MIRNQLPTGVCIDRLKDFILKFYRSFFYKYWFSLKFTEEEDGEGGEEGEEEEDEDDDA